MSLPLLRVAPSILGGHPFLSWGLSPQGSPEKFFVNIFHNRQPFSAVILNAYVSLNLYFLETYIATLHYISYSLLNDFDRLPDSYSKDSDTSYRGIYTGLTLGGFRGLKRLPYRCMMCSVLSATGDCATVSVTV